MHPQFTSVPTRRKKYGRNSSDEQHKMATINSQVAAVDEWDREHGGDPQTEDWYIDEGWSGFILERPMLDQLRDDARDPDRDWDELVIYDTSRLSREPGHRLYILEPEFKELGIKVIYVASPVYGDTADGRAMAGVQGVFDKWYAEKTRETMRRGLREAVKAGRCWWAPYGYEVVKIAGSNGGKARYEIRIKANEASIVREIFQAVLDSQSTTQIARDLNARGIPGAKGGKWWTSTIAAMIHEPYYVGIAGFRKREYCKPKYRLDDTITHRRRSKTGTRPIPRQEWVAEIAVPSLIEPAVQQRCIAILAGNRRNMARATERSYPLRGLLRCAMHVPETGEVCGCRLVARTKKRKRGSEFPFYQCNRRYAVPTPQGRLMCINYLPGEATDDLIWDAVIAALGNSERLAHAYAQMHDVPRARRKRLEEALIQMGAEHDKLVKRLRTQQEMRETGEYTRVEYEIARAGILPQLERVEEAIKDAQAELPTISEPQIDYQTLELLAARIKAQADVLTRAERAATLRELLTRIDVYPDRFEVRGALGSFSVARPDTFRHQLSTARTRSGKLVPFCLVIARVAGPQQDRQGTTDPRYTLALG